VKPTGRRCFGCQSAGTPNSTISSPVGGISPVVATAIIAAIGNGSAFRRGREFAAWLGVVPRQYSTGGKTKLLDINKRGNVYLRKILIHGARAAVLRIKRDRAPIGRLDTDSGGAQLPPSVNTGKRPSIHGHPRSPTCRQRTAFQSHCRLLGPTLGIIRLR
jgi:Transposase IS116/IS110/IS902 family